MDAKRVLKMTNEMHSLIDDLADILRGRESLSELSAAELSGFSQKSDRLRELCKEMDELSLPDSRQ
jgi:hypothetical protein